MLLLAAFGGDGSANDDRFWGFGGKFLIEL